MTRQEINIISVKRGFKMSYKKVLSGIILVLVLSGLFGLVGVEPVYAALEKVNVYVTIADANGKLVLVQEEISVTDVDNDGKITINDALYVAHEAKYEGGAAAGYESAVSAYGISLNKLWGTANGGSYGYCINNASAMSMSDTIKEGDYINAYVYTDITTWSDTYCYFDVYASKQGVGKEFTLMLSAAGYDSGWNPVTLPVEGATVTVDGLATKYKTDKDGKVTVKFDKEGTFIVSATKETQTLVPPVCVVTVEKENAKEDSREETQESSAPNTGDKNNVLLLLGIMMFSGAIMCAARGKGKYEV